MKKNLRYLFAAVLMMFGMTASAAVVTDELTWEGLGLVGTNSSYNDFADKTFTSPAVYAGQASSGSGKYIQMRTTNNNSGIITTTSGGKLKAVTIYFNEATTDRKVSVYAKNEAYSAATDLYDESKQGTHLKDIAANDESKRLEIDDEYTFVGLRSSNGAIYIDKIEIEWESDAPVVIKTAKPTITPNGGEFEESIEVTLNHEDPNATISYTLNSEDWTTSQEAQPGKKITLNQTTVLRAKAFDYEHEWSDVVTVTFTKVAPVEAQVVTIAEFNAAEVSNDVWYQLTGVVKNLQDGDQYGNFDIEDETGSVYVYGLLSEKGGAKKQFQALAAEKGIQNGSKLTLIGNRGYYAAQDKIEVMNAYFVSVDNSGVGPVDPVDPVELEGEGTKEKPYTVADVKAMKEFPTEAVWVKGFIVGTLASKDKFNEEDVVSNIALATTAEEAVASNTIPVALPSKSEAREKLNLVDNPSNKGKEVKVHGTIEAYFSTTGVKNVDDYDFATSTAISTVQTAVNEGVVYNLQGQQVMQPVKGLYIINGKKVVIK